MSLSLQIPGSKGYMFKMELQAEAQQLCDKSFTVVSGVFVMTQHNNASVFSCVVIAKDGLAAFKPAYYTADNQIN